MLLILAFHGGKLLMLIQFLRMWLVLLTFRRQLLLPSSERKYVKLASFCVYGFMFPTKKDQMWG
jgi:hypothetical protein